MGPFCGSDDLRPGFRDTRVMFKFLNGNGDFCFRCGKGPFERTR